MANWFDVARGAGSMLGAGSQASADNRSAELDAQAEAERLNQQRLANFYMQVLARETEGRVSANDAIRNLGRAEYLKTAKGYTPTDPRLKQYGFGPKAPTSTEQIAAEEIARAAQDRLTNGNPIPEIEHPGQFQFDPKLIRGSALEKILGYAGAGLTGLSAIKRGQKK